MFSTFLYVSLLSVLFLNLIISRVHADVDLEKLSQTVSEHTNILDQFSTHTENVKVLEKKLSDYEPRLTIIEVQTKNLQSEINDLTNASVAYIGRLDKFVDYQNKTDRLEFDTVKLAETMSTFGKSLSDFDTYKTKTNELEDRIIDLSSVIDDNNDATEAISKDVQTFGSTCSAQHDTYITEIKKISALQEEQVKISKKLDDVIEDIDGKKNSTSENLSVLKENCIAEQNKLKSKVQKLDTIVSVQEDSRKKLENLVTRVEKQKNTSIQNLNSLQNSITAQSKQIKTELQKIEPVTKAQAETMKKLDGLITSLNLLKNEQQTLQKSLKQLSDQFNTFVKGHTPPPTTVAPTTPTPDPNSLPVVFTKHVHARGNNIVVTI